MVMSGQPKSSPAASATGVENDLDTTAELPVLDVASYEAATEAPSGNTDTWIVPAPEVAEPPPELPPRSDATALATGTRSHLEVSLHALSDDLRGVEERVKHKGERLVEIEEALAGAQAERSASEQRSQQLTVDLEQARVAAVAAEARIAELQRALEQRESDNRGWGALKKALEEKLALRDKALALVQRDLTTAQALAATYLESLRSMEGRRSLFEEISTSLYWEVDSRETRLTRLQEQLSATAARAKDLEAALSERTARISRLEKEAGELTATALQREQTLRQATLSGDDLKRNVGTLTEGVASRDERIRTLEVTTMQQSALLAERQAEVDRVTAERASLSASVDCLEASLSGETARAVELETASRRAQSRCEELEAANTVQRKRAEQLDTELAAVRAELQQRAAALQEAGAERNEHMGRIAATEAQVEELERRILEQQEFVRVLQVECNAGAGRVKELEGDLRAAEDMINRLEGELRGRNSRLDELEKTNQHWRATVEEARNALIDRDSLIRRLEEETANSAVLLGAIQERLDATGTHEIAPDGNKRLLIRSDGGSDVVHVLTRKTTVGRTPDNDLQVDAKYISRHHAVILAGPVHTIIEDLNSTNGVLVNGRRITRQSLKDGDAVMIGKTLFRFAVRPAVERRS